MNWSETQILSLAPNSGTASKAQSLAQKVNWSEIGKGEESLWGQCKGSGKRPYQVSIDLTGPAFKCSCPSRQFPCKHGLALLLLHQASPSLFETGKMPESTQEWIQKRRAKNEQKTQPVDPAEAEKRQKAQEKREVKRLLLMKQGLEDLENWLTDIVRQGLASLENKPYKFWSTAAARMVDAKVPGAANTIKRMALLPGSGVHWPEEMAFYIADLFMLIRSFGLLDKLPEEYVQDVKTAAGMSVKRETVANLPPVEDLWAVLGSYERVEEELTSRSTWLFGKQTKRYALILDFSFGGKGFQEHYFSGTILQGKLAFFPGNWPVRALFTEPPQQTQGAVGVLGFDRFSDMQPAMAAALGKNPFLKRLPVVFSAALPISEKQGLSIVDPDNKKIPCMDQAYAGWKLISLSGGNSVSVFGEWDGKQFAPISAWNPEVFVDLIN